MMLWTTDTICVHYGNGRDIKTLNASYCLDNGVILSGLMRRDYFCQSAFISHANRATIDLGLSQTLAMEGSEYLVRATV